MAERDDSEQRLDPFLDWYDNVEWPEESPQGEEVVEGIYKFPKTEEDELIRYGLSVNETSFNVSVEKFRTDHYVSVYYPSKLNELSADQLYKEVTCVVDSAFPSGHTPSAILTHQDGRLEKLDLSNFWDGQIYEQSVNNPELKGVIHYFESNFNMPASLSPEEVIGAFFSHGFGNVPGGVMEFVRMTHSRASYLGDSFAGELLSRNREYKGYDFKAEVQELTEKMKFICDQNPPPKIGF